MRDEQQVNRVSLGVVVGVSVAVLTAAGGAAWWASNSLTPAPQSQPLTIQPTPPSTAVQPGVEKTANIYLLKDTGTNFELVPQPVKVTGEQPNKVLQGAFQQLLTEPQQGNVGSTIPDGTKVLGVQVENDGIHVNLSEEFALGGGSASMSGRLGQVVYTATTLDPNAKVWIEVEGKPLEVLGGEGLVLDQPLTRNSFKENFPL